jgi:general secretion pathway protein E
LHPIPQDQLPLAEGLSREFLLHHRVCPWQVTAEGELVVAAEQGSRTEACDDIAFAYGLPVVLRHITGDQLERLIEHICVRGERAVELERVHAADDDLAADVRDLANQPPVIRYVNLLVRDAFDAGASDIHIEAERGGVTVRIRLDGVRVEAQEPPPGLHAAVVSRIKLLAELDIAERRKPQDGRIRVRLEQRELDLRVSTVPTLFGESVVLRLLDRGGRPVTLNELGMPADVLGAMQGLVARPHGMILCTGPTGSGKTTTLYAALGLRDARAEKIVTVEDPVEYQLVGITQVPVHRQAGVTFASALRSILRQDPDVIMVGEMRDAETAEVAVQAAMTGHLVFSTLHTNDAVGALPRLLDLGVPEYLVSATVEGVLAQRLVRRNCPECLTAYQPHPDELERLSGWLAGGVALRRGTGCAACRGTGFRGRIGLFELLEVDESLRDAIARGESRSHIRALTQDAGLRPMRSDGWEKVRAGLTTVEEVLRVTEQ